MASKNICFCFRNAESLKFLLSGFNELARPQEEGFRNTRDTRSTVPREPRPKPSPLGTRRLNGLSVRAVGGPAANQSLGAKSRGKLAHTQHIRTARIPCNGVWTVREICEGLIPYKHAHIPISGDGVSKAEVFKCPPPRNFPNSLRH